MPDRKAYMREYMKARRAAEKAGLRPSKQSAHDVNTPPAQTEQAVPVVTPEVAQVPVAPVAAPEKKLTAADILRRVAPAPDDDCQSCGHAWHNDEDGCREPLDRRRRCGCKLYRSAADVLAALGVDPSEDPF